MKPIGQTFFVSKSQNGTAGIYLYRIDVYFKSIDPDKGIVLQLRETDNGYPTSIVIPNSECFAFPDGDYQDAIANPDDYGGLWDDQPTHNIAYASDDSSVATSFTFKQPPYLEANKSYAFVLIPGGGTDKYEVWTSEIGQTDVLTNNLVSKNNDTGTLFISSNDIQWTPIQTEDIKFSIHQASFTNTSGSAILNVANTDSFYIKDTVGTFRKGEMAYVSNAVFDISRLVIASNSAAFTTSETVYQSNGTANIAFGTLTFANTTNLIVANTRGVFDASYEVKGITSTSNASLSSVVDDTTFSSGSNTITVPYSGVFSNGDYIFVAKSSLANGLFRRITSINSNTEIRVNANMPYTESTGAFITRYNKLTSGFINTQEIYDTSKQSIVLLFQRNSSSSNNNSNIDGQYVFGLYSAAVAKIESQNEIKYNSITPLILEFEPKDTSLTYSFKGLDDDGNYTSDDSSYLNIKNHLAAELYDKQRILANYSNELVNRSGSANTSLRIKIDFATGNNEISPNIDMMSRYITLTENILVSDENLTGYYLTLNKTLDNQLDVPAVGSTVTLGSNTAEVAYANTTFVRVINNSGKFPSNPGNMTFDTFTANVSIAEYYSESLDNGFDDVARYISKSTSLAPNQEADDAITYLTAYRPVNTGIYVYIKALGVNDSSDFENRVWSQMPEKNSIGLLSSKANINDYVELEYNLPTSKGLFADSGSCGSTSANVGMFNTETLSVGDFIYVKDNANSTFTVREVISVTNSSSVVVSSNVGFTSSNANIGVIPGLSHENGVFKYHDNEYISKYVNSSGDVHDTIKQFAIKIIMAGDNHYIIPRVADMRTLALQN